MNKIPLCVLILSVGSSVAAAAPHHFYWYGSRLPLLESQATLVVELEAKSSGEGTQIASELRARFLTELNPQGRRLLFFDVSALSASAQRRAREQLVKRADSVTLLMPLLSRRAMPEVVVDRYVLVRFNSSFTRDDVRKLGRKLNFVIERTYAYAREAYRLELTSVGAAIALANDLVESRRALYAEPDRLLAPRLYSPFADDWVGMQWHLESVNGSDIGAEQAWTSTTGAPTTIVAVADTGVEMTHPEFQGEGKIVAPLDVYDGDLDPTPGRASSVDGHGTACAGLVAAAADGGGGVSGGMVGVCPDCAVMPIRLGPGQGMWEIGTLVTAFDHTWQYGAKVMSNSWGFGDQYIAQSVYEAMHAAVDHGVTIFFASGNDGSLMAKRDFSSDPSVIAVGGSSYASRHVSYSNTGPALDIVAPTLEQGTGSCPAGPGIHTVDMTGSAGFNPREDSSYSGWCADDCTVSEDYTCFFSGTSAACPIAAGAGALLVAFSPDLTPAQVRWVLTSSADKVGDARYVRDFNEEMGFGRVNVGAAVILTQSGYICMPVAEADTLCADGLDNDCDGIVDGEDFDCGGVFPAPVDMSGWGLGCSWEGEICGDDLECVSVGDMGAGGTCGMPCWDVCPEGFSCVQFSANNFALCMPLCSNDEDCPESFVCAQNGPSSDQICTRECSSDNDCWYGVKCARTSGLCGMNSRVGDTADGAAPGDPAAGDPLPGDTVVERPVHIEPAGGCSCGGAPAGFGALVFWGLFFVRRRRE